jgi:hypothetical protein
MILVNKIPDMIGFTKMKMMKVKKYNWHMKRHYFFLALLSLLLGCSKKEIPSPSNGAPVFYFDGHIDGESTTLQAGVNGLYMYSDYYRDDQNLMSLKSYLAPQNCDTCEPYLSFELKDVDVSSGNTMVASLDQLLGTNALHSFSMDSVVHSTVVETFQFIPHTSLGTFHWDFGDGTTSSLPIPAHVFTGGGMRNVSLIHEYQGQTDTLSNWIDVTTESICRPQFEMTPDTITYMVSVYVSSIAAFPSYIWSFGDGTTGTGPTNTHLYQGNGIYPITLTGSGGSCGTAKAFTKKVAFGMGPSTFLANYSYSTSVSTLTAVMPRINASACIITYRKNGVEYKSYKNIKGVNQSSNVVFTLNGFTPYLPNEKGYKTAKINGSLDTYLYNQQNVNDSIRVVSNQVTLAVAYP